MRKLYTVERVIKPKVRRRGVHAKTQESHLKTSKNYTKKYRGQGK